MEKISSSNSVGSPLRRSGKDEAGTFEEAEVKRDIFKRQRFSDLDRFSSSSPVSSSPDAAHSPRAGVDTPWRNFNDAAEKIRDSIKRQQEFRESVRPTLENLIFYIESGNDASAVDLLRRGARLDTSPRSLGIYLELFESPEMPMTTTYLIRNDLLSENLALEHFEASLISENAELSYYLSKMPSIRECLADLDNDKRRLLRHTYSFNMLKFMTRNALEQTSFRKFQRSVELGMLDDTQFVALMRQGQILKWATDEQLIYMRNNVDYNPYEIVCDLRELFHWINRPPKDAEQISRFGFELDLFMKTLEATRSGNIKFLRAIFSVSSLAMESISAA